MAERGEEGIAKVREILGVEQMQPRNVGTEAAAEQARSPIMEGAWGFVGVLITINRALWSDLAQISQWQVEQPRYYL